MKKINSPLIIAAIILILILGVILFPKLFTNKSPYNINKMIFSHEDGKLITTPAPFSPSKDFIFGSDDMGRDIYAYIIYGTRLTILLGVFVALGRFIIALPIALFAGFGNKAAKGVIKVFGVLFSAIPAVLISLIVLKMSFFVKLDRESSIMAFVLVLSLVGWPKISRLIMERVETLNNQTFIKSEVAIGKNRFKIALENVIPHLAPELIVLQLMEIARSLAIIMTLGVFNVFVGNLKYVEDVGEGALNLSNVSFNPEWGRLAFYNVSFEPEWASMLATSRSMLESAPWAVLFPALAFFISILAFNLLGEGLRNAMQKKDSRVIPMMRNLFTFNIAKLWKNSKTSSKIIFFTIVILIGSVIFVPYFISANEYSIKEDKTNEISFEEVIIGTQEAQETAEKIAEKMRELGLSPMVENSYYLDYEIEPDVILAAHSVRFFNENMQISAKLNEDYAFLSAGSFKNDGTLYDATQEDLFNIEDYAKFRKKYILIDKEYYEDSAIEYFISDIQKHVDISGVLLIARQDESVTNFFIQEDKVFTLLLSKEFAKSLKESDDLNVVVSAQIEHLAPKGRNVIGIIGNYDPDMEEKAILIGMNYNYTREQGAQVLNFNLDLLERLCKTYDNQRAIIFMFVDGTLCEEYNGLYSIAENLPYTSYKVDVFIDLTRIDKSDFDSVEFSSALAPFAKPFGWSIGHQLEKNFRSKNITFDELDKIYLVSEYYLTQSDALNLMFWDRGIATVVVGTGDSGEQQVNIYDIGRILLKVINENSY